MANDLSVTLNAAEGALDVDQKDNANHVSQSPNAQTITWQLTGNAAQGAFTGFAWMGTQPPTGIFGQANISANGNKITMTDSNTSSTTAGTWIYKLTATINGTSYSTLSTLNPRGGTTDPTIKNN